MLNDQEDYVVLDGNDWLYKPIEVGYNGDWPAAVLAAGKLDRAEVIVTTSGTLTGVCVYSDDPDVASSPWWASQIREVRRAYGR